MKTIYSLRIRLALRKQGFEPIMEFDNEYRPGLKCWVYEETPDFIDTFDNIMRELGYQKEANNG